MLSWLDYDNVEIVSGTDEIPPQDDCTGILFEWTGKRECEIVSAAAMKII
jgi:hypothetical protein